MGANRLKRSLHRLRRAPAAPGFGHIEHEPNPPDPDTLADFELFAVVKTWMDEDVIEATVRNAMVQGATRVFIVDNGSTDQTVARAVEAGAAVAEIYQTEWFDGRLVQPLMNAVVARESLRCGAEHVWWLYLDSDEFPEGPDGLSVREYLATLDRRFRIGRRPLRQSLPRREARVPRGLPPDRLPASLLRVRAGAVAAVPTRPLEASLAALSTGTVTSC